MCYYHIEYYASIALSSNFDNHLNFIKRFCTFSVSMMSNSKTKPYTVYPFRTPRLISIFSESKIYFPTQYSLFLFNIVYYS